MPPTTAIATCGSRLEGALKVAALGSAGFDASLGSDDAGGLHPEMSMLYCGAYRVLVPADQADDALAVLTSMDAGDHQLDDEMDPDGEDLVGAGPLVQLRLDGRRRGWAAVAVVLAALVVLYRLLESAFSFGIF